MFDYDMENYGYNRDQERNARAIQSMNPRGELKEKITEFEKLKEEKTQELKKYQKRLANGERLLHGDMERMRKLQVKIDGLTDTINRTTAQMQNLQKQKIARFARLSIVK